MTSDPAPGFHPQAATSLQAKAASLQNRLAPRAGDRTDGPRFPTPHVASTLTDDDIQSLDTVTATDAAGAETARYFEHAGELFGFAGDAHAEFLQLCSAMQKTSALRGSVSLETCQDLVMEWFRKRLAGSDTPLTTFLEERRDELVDDITIVIPVHELLIQSPLIVGRVDLRPVDSAQIDEWVGSMNSTGISPDVVVEVTTRKLRKPFQGRAASWFSTRAERVHAFQLAQLETRRALSALRLFSPAAFLPGVRCNCVPWGEEHVLRESYMVLSGGEFFGPNERLVAPESTYWRLPDTALRDFLPGGLTDLSNLLRQDEHTPLEEAVLRGLMVYSRATLTSDPTDKLIHIFVALESLLLKNENEPPVGAVSERMAFIAGRSVEERLEVAALVKWAYSMRSKYVHHAVPLADIERLREFMLRAWDVLMALVRSRQHYSSVAEMHTALERRKFQ